MLLPLGAKGRGGYESWYTYFSLLLLVAILLKHNVNEKNMRNIDVRIHVKLEVNCQSRFVWDPSSSKKWSTQKIRPHKKLTQAENFEPRKKNWPT